MDFIPLSPFLPSWIKRSVVSLAASNGTTTQLALDVWLSYSFSLVSKMELAYYMVMEFSVNK